MGIVARGQIMRWDICIALLGIICIGRVLGWYIRMVHLKGAWGRIGA